MEEKIKEYSELNNGLQTAFIDRFLNSSLTYRPEFITNNFKQGKKVLISVEQELLKCDEFIISVAFMSSLGNTEEYEGSEGV